MLLDLKDHLDHKVRSVHKETKVIRVDKVQ